MYTFHEAEDVCCSHVKDCFHLAWLGEGLLRLQAGRALLVLPMDAGLRLHPCLHLRADTWGFGRSLA